jgi:hypothetical protein
MLDAPQDTTSEQHPEGTRKVPTPYEILGPDLFIILQKRYDQTKKDPTYRIESDFGVLTFTRWSES